MVALMVGGLTAALAGDITLAAADGTALHAVEYGTGANGVVLVHDKGRTAADFAWYGEKLATQGFHVVAVDLRGHGASKPPEVLTDADFPKMSADVAAAVTWLGGHGATKVQIVGDKLGANLAIVAGAEDPLVTSVIALSPGLNVAGVTPTTAMEKFGKRSLLVVASAEDSYATRSAGVLEQKALGDKHYEVLENAGTGVKMLNKAPSLEALMLTWLNGTWGQQNGAAATGAGTAPTVGMDNQEIKTTGQKYGEAPPPPKDPPKPSAPVDLDE